MYKMSLLSSSWCFPSFKRASQSGAFYSMAMHSVDIAWLIYSVVTIHQIKSQFGDSVQKSFIVPGSDILAYITIGLSVFAIILSGVQLYWINQGYRKSPNMFLWLWILIGIRAFHAAVGIYFMAYLGGGTLRIVVNTSPVCIFGAIYWFAAAAGLVVFGVMLFCYVQELKEETYGRRKKPYMIGGNDVYSPTTRALTEPDDEKAPPVDKYKSAPKRNRFYYGEERRDKRPERQVEFESIV